MFVIRPMTLELIPAIVEIEQSSHVQPWHEGFFVEELHRSQSHSYVARLEHTAANDSVLGYICFWLVADEIQIFNLAVHVAHRRRGIGRALLLYALKFGYLHRARVALLEVRRSNEAAQRLYSSLGFQPAGQRNDYYGGMREPAMLMELEMDRGWHSRWIAVADA
jgi:[ribosomal protein S18]-alanine N-acetyltransferase